MKKIVFIGMLFFCSQLFAVLEYSIVDLDVTPVVSAHLKHERSLFVDSWQHYLGQDCQQKLHELFDKEEQAFDQEEAGRLFFHMTINDQIIGYVSYSIDQSYIVCIEQFVLHPDYLSELALQELLFSIFDYMGSVLCVYIELFADVSVVRNMLHVIGFVESKTRHKALELVPEAFFIELESCDQEPGYEVVFAQQAKKKH